MLTSSERAERVARLDDRIDSFRDIAKRRADSGTDYGAVRGAGRIVHP